MQTTIQFNTDCFSLMRISTFLPSEGEAASSSGDLFSLFFSSVCMLCCINRPAIFSFSWTPSPEPESAFCIYSKQTQQILHKNRLNIKSSIQIQHMYSKQTQQTLHKTDSTDSIQNRLNACTQNSLNTYYFTNRLDKQFLKHSKKKIVLKIISTNVLKHFENKF